MKPAEWFRPPRIVLTLFISLMTVYALALGWLGWQVLVQDREVEAQRRQGRTEIAADRALAAIEGAFALGDAEVTVTTNGEVRITPPGRIAYTPSQIHPIPIAPDTFVDAEALEFQKHDPDKAAEAYARLAESASATLRAESLVRLGRTLRHERKWREAVNAYNLLETLGTTLVVGMPADLVARAARSSTREES